MFSSKIPEQNIIFLYVLPTNPKSIPKSRVAKGNRVARRKKICLLILPNVIVELCPNSYTDVNCMKDEHGEAITIIC